MSSMIGAFLGLKRREHVGRTRQLIKIITALDDEQLETTFDAQS